MKVKIVREMDELGRIVLPQEIRNALGWGANTKVSVIHKNDRVMLRRYTGSCFVCGSEKDIRAIRNKFICENCIHEMEV